MLTSDNRSNCVGVVDRHRQVVRRGQAPSGPGGAAAADVIGVVRARRGGRRPHAHAQRPAARAPPPPPPGQAVSTAHTPNS